MESFNKKMQDKFEEHSTDIPNEFSWDNLGAGIVEGIEKKKDSHKRFLLLFLVVLGLAGITATAIYYTNNYNNKSIITQETKDEKVNNLVKSNSNNLETSTNQTNIIDVKPQTTFDKTNLNAAKIENKTIEKNQENIIPNNSLTIKHMISQDDGNDRLNNEETILTPIKINQQEVEGFMPNSNGKTIAPSTSFAVNENRISAINFGLEPKIPNSKLSPKPFHFTYSPNVSLKELSLPETVIDSDPPLYNPRHTIGLSGGVIGWNFTSEAFDLENYETTLSSWNVGLNYSYLINKRWSISTGIIYTAHRSRMSHIFKTVTEHYNEDAIQNVFNAITGETHQRTGAQETVTTLTSIVHHNTIYSLSIPLSIQYMHPMNDRLSVGLAVGLQWNSILSRDGRGINQALQLIEYSELSAVQSSYFSGLFSLTSEYKLQKNVRLELMVIGNQALSSFEFTPSDNRRIGSIGLNMGVKKYF